MTVRSKMKLTSITSHAWSPNAKTLKFSAQYDPDIPEDQRFQKATPTASIEIQIDNPAAVDKFELGQDYYVDFSPVNAAASATAG